MERRHYGIMELRHYGMKPFILCTCLLFASAAWADFSGKVVAVIDGEESVVGMSGKESAAV